MASSLLTNQGFSPKEAELFLSLLSPGSSKEAQIAASLYFRKKLSNCQEPPSDMVNRLIVELIACLNRPSQEIQLNVAWALTNLACGTREDTHFIVGSGGITALFNKARGTSGEVRDQAIWALGNIAADCRNCRELVRQSRLLPLLIGFLKLPEYREMDTRKTLIWCTVNILRGGMGEIVPSKFESLIEQLHITMETPGANEEVLSDTVWSVAYLLDHLDFNSERVNYALNHPSLIPTIIGFLSHQSTRVLAGSLRVVGNIVTGTDEQATAVLEMNLLSQLVPLIDSTSDHTVRETLWILSNIAAGTEEHISQLLGIRGMAETLIRLCGDPNLKKRKEAHWTIVNCLMGANAEDYFYLLSGGVGHELVRILEEDADLALIDRTLQTINHSLRDRPERIGHTVTVFKVVGLVGVLHKRVLSARASERPDHFNWQLASNILREFFNVDPTQEVQPAPTVRTLHINLKRRHG